MSINWPEKKIASWEAFQRRGASGPPANQGPATAYTGETRMNAKSKNASPPLTEIENQWLKKQWHGEFDFLRSYQLSIYEEEDREEGRRILRALMDADSDRQDDHGHENSLMRKPERDPMSYVADYHFSEKELDWIHKHFKHSGDFLLSYNLRPWEDKECLKGRTIVHAMSGKKNLPPVFTSK